MDLMRALQTIWRLTLGRRRVRPGSKTANKPTVQTDPKTTDLQDCTARLLGTEPPTRTLQ
jgi:hypothetical protein